MIQYRHFRMGKEFIFHLCLVLLTADLLFCGSLVISGRVVNTDNGRGLPNVNIIGPNQTGTVTDRNGSFFIEVNGDTGFQLVVSRIGFETKYVDIDQSSSERLIIQLRNTVIPLDAVVVQGLISSRLASETVDILDLKVYSDMRGRGVTDVFQNIPGVDIQAAHEFGRNVNVSMRGSSDYKPGGYNNRVMLLLDGIPILIPNSGAADWNSLPMEIIQRLEVVHGPASALYGHNAVGGVINMITEDPVMSEPWKGMISYGNLKTTKAGAAGSVAIGKMKAIASLTYLSSDGHRFNSDYEHMRGSFKTDRKTDKSTLSITGILAHSTNGHPGFQSPDYPELISYRRSERTSGYIQSSLYSTIKPGISLSTHAAFHAFNTQYTNRKDTPLTELEDGSSYNDQSLLIRSEVLSTGGTKWMVLMGGEFSFDQTEVTVLNPIYSRLSQLNIAPYLQSRYSLGGGWGIGLGLRLDHRRINPGQGYPVRSFTDWSPKLNLVYNRLGKRTFHFSLNKGYRAPSISELYLLHTTSYGLTHQGNPELKPEQVWAVEVGYDHPHSEKFSWGLDLFYNRYSQMIDFVYNVPVKAVNREGVVGFGAEWRMNWRMNQILRIKGNYTFLKFEDLNPDETILYRPAHKASMTLFTDLSFATVTLTGRYTASQYYEDFLSSDYSTDADNRIRFPLKTLPQKLIINGSLQRDLGRISLSLNIQNLFHQDYMMIQDYPMPGRTWIVSISTNIKKRSYH